jgi:hypothetical protein
MLCNHCGRPVASGVWIGSGLYHDECTRGPGYSPNYYGSMGCTPFVPLTEDRVRQIVREEIERRAIEGATS